jgi:hypothetical protein
MALERFEENQPRDFIAVAAYIFDLYSFIKLSGKAIEGFIRLFFRERRSAPLKEPDQRPPQIFISFTGLCSIISQAIQQLRKGFCGQPEFHLPSLLLIAPKVRRNYSINRHT